MASLRNSADQFALFFVAFFGGFIPQFLMVRIENLVSVSLARRLIRGIGVEMT